ncbi:phosphoenolpyruvate carboxykinase [Patescibacteria group bacterium]|nr:phosphoenolpyruvate carboxykinase [Patescibacteria group bacterium]
MQLFKDIEKKLSTHEPSYWMPGSFDLRIWSQKYVIPNRDNISVFHTKVRSRMADKTITDVNELSPKEKKRVEKIIEQAYNNIKKREMLIIQRSIGTHTKQGIKFRIYLPKDFPQLGFMAHRNFFDCASDKEVEVTTINIPDFPKQMVLVDPKTNITFVLGSDYYGELKMSLLRMAMNIAREKNNSLGLHAGSKVYWVKNTKKKMIKRGVLIFGLSGTGKTTITTINHGLKYPERIRIRQDDINIMDKKTFCAGTERNFYIKTDNVLEQRSLLPAATSKTTIIENVPVKYGGYAFDDIEFCPNGRAIVSRYAIPHTDAKVDLDKVDIIFFNTRRFDIPIVGRLISPEQAATFFMLGESTQTSAGTEDKSQIGKPMRVVGFDPFIIKPLYKNGQRFYEILKKNPHVKVYVVNTGKVGGIDKGTDIKPDDTAKSILEIIRGGVEWKYDPTIGYDIPTKIPGLDLKKFDPYEKYPKDEYKKIMKNLRKDRMKYMEQFPELTFVKFTK